MEIGWIYSIAGVNLFRYFERLMFYVACCLLKVSPFSCLFSERLVVQGLPQSSDLSRAAQNGYVVGQAQPADTVQNQAQYQPKAPEQHEPAFQPAIQPAIQPAFQSDQQSPLVQQAPLAQQGLGQDSQQPGQQQIPQIQPAAVQDVVAGHYLGENVLPQLQPAMQHHESDRPQHHESDRLQHHESDRLQHHESDHLHPLGQQVAGAQPLDGRDEQGARSVNSPVGTLRDGALGDQVGAGQDQVIRAQHVDTQPGNAPAGQPIVQDSRDVRHDDTQHAVRHQDGFDAHPRDIRINMNQEDDQAGYIAHDKDRHAPVGQPVGDLVHIGELVGDLVPTGQPVGDFVPADLASSDQVESSPLSLQALSEHYELPARLDTNLKAELMRADNELKSQLSFNEDRPQLASLQDMILGAASGQSSPSSNRNLPLENLSYTQPAQDYSNSLTSSNHSDIIDSHNNLNLNVHDLPALPVASELSDMSMHDRTSSLSDSELLAKLSHNVVDKGELMLSSVQEHDMDFEGHKPEQLNSFKVPDHYEEAVGKILSKEQEMDLPEIDSPYLHDLKDDRPPTDVADHGSPSDNQELQQSSDFLSNIKPSDPNKKLSHGFLYLNITHLLKGSELDPYDGEEVDDAIVIDQLDDDQLDDNPAETDTQGDRDAHGDKSTTPRGAVTTTDVAYTTHSSDWVATTDSTSHFDNGEEPHDSFGSVLHDIPEHHEEHPVDRQNTLDLGQQLAFGQKSSLLSKALGSVPKQTLEDQLRLPVQTPYNQVIHPAVAV